MALMSPAMDRDLDLSAVDLNDDLGLDELGDYPAEDLPTPVSRGARAERLKGNKGSKGGEREEESPPTPMSRQGRAVAKSKAATVPPARPAFDPEARCVEQEPIPYVVRSGYFDGHDQDEEHPPTPVSRTARASLKNNKAQQAPQHEGTQSSCLPEDDLQLNGIADYPLDDFAAAGDDLGVAGLGDCPAEDLPTPVSRVARAERLKATRG